MTTRALAEQPVAAVEILTRLALRRGRTTIVVVLALSVVAVAGAVRVRPEFGYRTILGPEHPTIRRLESFIEHFGGGFPLEIVWSCGDRSPCTKVWDRASLAMAAALAGEIASVPGVHTVFGPATTPVVVPREGGLAVRRLWEGEAPAVDADRIAARVLEDPFWVGRLISRDGAAGIVAVQLVDTRSDTSVAVVSAVREILASHEAQGFQFALVGPPVEFAVAGGELAGSTARLVPLTMAIIAAVICGLFRRWYAAAVSLGTMGLALVWTLGVLGWLGWPNDQILQVLAPLILVVGVMDAIHLLSRYELEAGREGPAERGARERALCAAAREVGPACLVTTLTTAVALASFVISPLATFSRFGVISSLGVIVCLLLSFTLLPVLVARVPVRAPRSVAHDGLWRGFVGATVDLIERRTWAILAIAAATALVFGIGWIGQLRVETDIEDLYGARSQVTQWMRAAERHVDGLDDLEIEVRLPPGTRAEDPRVLERLTRFLDGVAERAGLDRATSVIDLLARLNRFVHDDDAAWQRPGDSLEANAQLLELVSFDPSLLEPWITHDRAALRLSLATPPASFDERERILRAVAEQAGLDLPDGWTLALTGGFAVEYEWVRAVRETQTRSFLVAFALVLIVLVLYLRSIGLALCGMVTTVLPAVVTLGTMGWLGLPLDVARAMIGAVVVGVAVDDAVHLLGVYRRRRLDGANAPRAVRDSIESVGRPVLVTSLALCLGFLSLLASPWEAISSFGVFISISIVIALVADLLVLPALLLVVERRSPGT